VTAFAAVDLGASSGRVMLGRIEGQALELVEVNRFANVPVRVAGGLQWDVLAIYRGILDGLRAGGREAGAIASIGIDSWAIDYGLLDSTGDLIGNPYHYRDTRTDGVMAEVLTRLPAEALYGVTGIQLLPFNTIFQLAAAAGTPALQAARTLVLIPDLISYWLTGDLGTEVTNASTTQLLDARTGDWSYDALAAVGVARSLFPPLRRPGDPAGRLTPSVLTETGLAGLAGSAGSVPVTAVGSHDTASAVVGVPADGDRFAYISCGTWSLVGLELDAPVLTEDARVANFTNEIGVDGTVRFLRNVMGLWLLQESLRTWNEHGLPADLETLLHEASMVAPFGSVIDPDHPHFLPPGDMPARIAARCEETGQLPPQSQAQTVRCILDSLALAYRATVDDAQRLSGRAVETVHLVGGGARNDVLCQLTADACALPVLAGPVEAAALGNLLVQARAYGTVGGGLADLRAVVRGSSHLTAYRPRGDAAAWDRAATRFAALRPR
jgi:rhamnulokinase